MEQLRIMTTRRDFIVGLTAVAGLQAKSGYEPKLMLQPYVWTQQFQKEKIPLAAGLELLFPAAQRAGYRRMELLNSFLTKELRENTAALVRRYNFDVPVVYHGGSFHDAEAVEQTIGEILTTADASKELSAGWIDTNCNPKKGRERKTDHELAIEASSLNRLGQRLKDRGMRLMLHQHDPDMAEGAREWRSNLHRTDPKLVWFCVDVHWVYRGKQDPMELLKEAGQRIASLHVRNSVSGVWSESLGDGDVDYRAVAKFLESIKYKGLIGVELAYEKDTNPTRPLEEDIRISREYAEKVFGF
jgi:inosose dehydratase